MAFRFLSFLLIFCCTRLTAQPGGEIISGITGKVADREVAGMKFVKADIADHPVTSFKTKDFFRWADTTATAFPPVSNELAAYYVELLLEQNRKAVSYICALIRYHEPVVVNLLDRHLLPRQFRVLPAVLSGSDTQAAFNQGAGIWNLFYPVARKAGLRVDLLLDERLDVNLSTAAAITAMAEIYKQTGSYHEMLKVFGCGPAYPFIRDTLLRQWCYTLPEQLTAWNYIYSNRNSLGLDEWNAIPVPADTVVPDGVYSLETMAAALDIKTENLVHLNPALTGLYALEGYPLYLPVNTADNFKAVKSELEKMEAAKPPEPPKSEIYRVRSGDTLSEIAEKFNVRINEIRAWNNIRGYTIYAGQELIIHLE